MLRWRTLARRATSQGRFENGYATIDWQMPAMAHTEFAATSQR